MNSAPVGALKWGECPAPVFGEDALTRSGTKHPVDVAIGVRVCAGCDNQVELIGQLGTELLPWKLRGHVGHAIRVHVSALLGRHDDVHVRGRGTSLTRLHDLAVIISP